jgi:hypothetical protein
MTGFTIPQGLLIEEDASGDRLYLEQQKLDHYFPQFSFAQSRTSGYLSVVGFLRTNAGRNYSLKIVLPSDYPHGIPAIFPQGWTAKCPHIYPPGNLCIMKSEQWRPFYTIAFVVAKSGIWLNKYDVYQRTHTWPGNEQFHDFVALRQVKKWWDSL